MGLCPKPPRSKSAVPALPRLHRVGHRRWLPTISGGGENPRAARKSWRAAHFPARLGSWVPRRDETDRRNRRQSSLSLEPPGTCVPRALGYNASPSLPGLRVPPLRSLCSSGQSRVTEFTLISGRSGPRGGQSDSPREKFQLGRILQLLWRPCSWDRPTPGPRSLGPN